MGRTSLVESLYPINNFWVLSQNKGCPRKFPNCWHLLPQTSCPLLIDAGDNALWSSPRCHCSNCLAGNLIWSHRNPEAHESVSGLWGWAAAAAACSRLVETGWTSSLAGSSVGAHTASRLAWRRQCSAGCGTIVVRLVRTCCQPEGQKLLASLGLQSDISWVTAACSGCHLAKRFQELDSGVEIQDES